MTYYDLHILHYDFSQANYKHKTLSQIIEILAIYRKSEMIEIKSLHISKEVV